MICPHCGREIESGKTEHENIIKMFNAICKDLPRCVLITNKRKSLLKARGSVLKDMDSWRIFFEKIQGSDFLCGRTGDWRIPSLDWILNETNFAKIYEGSYDNRKKEFKNALPDASELPMGKLSEEEREKNKEKISKLIKDMLDKGIGREMK